MPVWSAMTRAVREGERSAAAHVLTRGLVGRGRGTPAGLVRAVRGLIRYHRWGGPDVQSVAPLAQLLTDGVGNCTDLAVAVGTLGSLAGLGVRWAVGWDARGRIAHVWPQLSEGHGWIDADATPCVPLNGRPLDVPGASVVGFGLSGPIALARRSF